MCLSATSEDSGKEQGQRTPSGCLFSHWVSGQHRWMEPEHAAKQAGIPTASGQEAGSTWPERFRKGPSITMTPLASKVSLLWSSRPDPWPHLHQQDVFLAVDS